MIVKVLSSPGQTFSPFKNVGVTVIIAVTGVLVVLFAVKAGILPAPLLERPILGVLFVHV